MAALSAPAAAQKAPIQFDGLTSVTHEDQGSLKLLFTTAEKADAFVQKLRSPNGDGFACLAPNGLLFSWMIGYPAIKVNPDDENSPVYLDMESTWRTFTATYCNVNAQAMHPSFDEAVQLLKFVYNPE